MGWQLVAANFPLSPAQRWERVPQRHLELLQTPGLRPGFPRTLTSLSASPPDVCTDLCTRAHMRASTHTRLFVFLPRHVPAVPQLLGKLSWARKPVGARNGNALGGSSLIRGGARPHGPVANWG